MVENEQLSYIMLTPTQNKRITLPQVLFPNDISQPNGVSASLLGVKLAFDVDFFFSLV